jgi:cytochrome P450
MADQAAIFFLAGHETSASALSWTLWLLAAHPEWQERCAAEAAALAPDFAALSRLRVCRDAVREALRLYPPVPMMVRESSRAEVFRGHPVAPRS